MTGWIEDIKAYNKLDAFSYPIIADPDRSIANTYGMMDPDEMDSKGLPLTCRAVFVIGQTSESRSERILSNLMISFYLQEIEVVHLVPSHYWPQL